MQGFPVPHTVIFESHITFSLAHARAPLSLARLLALACLSYHLALPSFAAYRRNNTTNHPTSSLDGRIASASALPSLVLPTAAWFEANFLSSGSGLSLCWVPSCEASRATRLDLLESGAGLEVLSSSFSEFWTSKRTSSIFTTSWSILD